MARKIKADSTVGLVKAASDAKLEVLPPDGVVLDTEEARTLWRHITSARAPDAWRSIDLLLCGKWVGLELVIRKCAADTVDAVVDGKANPLLGIIDTMTKQQNSIIRLLSLGTKANRAIALNAGGKRAIDSTPKKKPGKKGDNVVNLLA